MKRITETQKQAYRILKREVKQNGGTNSERMILRSFEAKLRRIERKRGIRPPPISQTYLALPEEGKRVMRKGRRS